MTVFRVHAVTPELRYFRSEPLPQVDAELLWAECHGAGWFMLGDPVEIPELQEAAV